MKREIVMVVVPAPFMRYGNDGGRNFLVTQQAYRQNPTARVSSRWGHSRLRHLSAGGGP